jgi:hypothetical protein
VQLLQSLQARGYDREHIEAILKNEGYHHSSITRAFRDLQKLQEQEVSTQLYQYMLQMLQQGYPMQVIHQQLQGQGYGEKLLHPLFKDLAKVATSSQQQSSSSSVSQASSSSFSQAPPSPSPSPSFSTQQPLQQSTSTQEPHKHSGLFAFAVLAFILIAGGLFLAFGLADGGSESSSAQNNPANELAQVPQDEVVVAQQSTTINNDLSLKQAQDRASQSSSTRSSTSSPGGGTTASSGELVPVPTRQLDVNFASPQEYCAQDSNPSRCISALAFYREDSSICGLQESVSVRDACYEQFILNGQTQLCDLVESSSVTATCLSVA